MLEFIVSLVFGWNLITPSHGEPVPYFVADQECVSAIWWWDGQEWAFWDTDMPFTESDFFFRVDVEEEYGRDGWSEHWMLPGNIYWVYCE